MKKNCLFLFLFLIVVSSTYGQKRHGLYNNILREGNVILLAGVGPAYLHGDIGGKALSGLFRGSTFHPESTRGFVTFGIRYIFPNNLSFRLNLLYGNFVGTDSLTSFRIRNYSFTSKVFEFSFQGEFFLIGGPLNSVNSYYSTPHSLYLFAGAGNINFSPTLTGNTRVTDEINVKNGNAPIIPFGIGYEYYIGRGISFGSELALRYSYSDFSDGIKPSHSHSNDVLFNFNITVSYNFSLSRH